MPLNKYRDQAEEEICTGCKFYQTKPERIPDELIDHVVTAVNLSELQRAGATFAYPAVLEPAEWAALSGLQRGRDQADKLQRERDKKKPKPK